MFCLVFLCFVNFFVFDQFLHLTFPQTDCVTTVRKLFSFCFVFCFWSVFTFNFPKGFLCDHSFEKLSLLSCFVLSFSFFVYFSFLINFSFNFYTDWLCDQSLKIVFCFVLFCVLFCFVLFCFVLFCFVLFCVLFFVLFFLFIFVLFLISFLLLTFSLTFWDHSLKTPDLCK